MTCTIHFSPLSQHSRRVRAVAHELGMWSDIVWREIDLMAGAHMQPDYKRLNPMGKVPTLEENGLVLWESNAIMTYLADKKPSALYPRDPVQRADCHRWLFWESAHFGAAAVGLTFEKMMKQAVMKQPPNPAVVEYHELNWKRFAPVLDAHLAQREYVCGQPTLADFSLATIVMYSGPAGIDVASYKHLAAWLARMEARPSMKETAPRLG